MEERKGVVTMKGNPLTLLGPELKIGNPVPNFWVVDNTLSSVEFSSFSGKVCLIASVPSLDTPVCDLETRRFNSEAGNLRSDIQILTISMDLPFAQKRWCGAAGIDKVITLSDHKDASFGTAFGVLIKELRLLARAIFIIDRQGILRHVQIVKDLSQEPDYDQTLTIVKNLT